MRSGLKKIAERNEYFKQISLRLCFLMFIYVPIGLIRVNINDSVTEGYWRKIFLIGRLSEEHLFVLILTGI